MTTREAFLHLISKRGWYKDLGITQGAADSLVNRAKHQGSLTNDKMEEILRKAGYRLEVEAQWSDIKSDIENLVDMPEEYYGCQEWMDLHSHMFAPNAPFIEKIRAMDIYMKKLKAIPSGKSIIEKLLEEVK